MVLVRIDECGDHLSRRSSSKNALAVFRISLARLTSSFRRRFDLFAFGGRQAWLTSVDAGSTQPRMVSTGMPVKSCMPVGRWPGLIRRFLASLFEHADDSIFGFLVVTGHTPFSPFGGERSLHQTQGGSITQRNKQDSFAHSKEQARPVRVFTPRSFPYLLLEETTLVGSESPGGAPNPLLVPVGGLKGHQTYFYFSEGAPNLLLLILNF